VTALAAGAITAGCGSDTQQSATVSTVTAPDAGITTAMVGGEAPPTPQHLDVASRSQEASAEAKASSDQPTPAEMRAAARHGKMPAASAGTNGSFDPDEAQADTAIVPQTVPANPNEAKSRAILLGRTALAPADAPDEVKEAISAANQIVGKPYIWGGGHSSWYSKGYDCSGAVSYALGGAGLLEAPVSSGQLEHWGKPGPGRWITVYANAGHTYAVIAGLRWDTVGDAHGTGPRWHAESPYPQGFVARHPPGL
jgi:cell wall-associated NlpC family hydrolase